MLPRHLRQRFIGKRNHSSFDSANNNSDVHYGNECERAENFRQKQISDVVTELHKLNETEQHHLENLVPKALNDETACNKAPMAQGGKRHSHI